MKKIQVLLATYNGEKYVKEQINSVLINFDYLPDFDCSILVSDDNSTDSTVKTIIDNFADDNRVKIISFERKGGVKNNFLFLIHNSDADYIFFCDQDDLWLPEKLKLFVDEFSKHEEQSEVPLLIHSDLCVADSILSPIHKSMFSYQKLNKSPSFSNLIVSNSITGCVLGINRRLHDLVKSSKIDKSIMHDWYIGLVALCFGNVIFIPKSLILYRQHLNNQVGAKEFSLRKAIDMENFEKIKKSINLTKKQAELFLLDFSHSMNEDELKILKSYIKSFEKSMFYRMKLFYSYGFRKYGFLRNSVFFIFYVLFAKF